MIELKDFLSKHGIVLLVGISILIVVLMKNPAPVNDNKEVLQYLHKLDGVLVDQNKKFELQNQAILDSVTSRSKGELSLIRKVQKDVAGIQSIKGSFDKVSDDSILVILQQQYAKSIKRSTIINSK